MTATRMSALQPESTLLARSASFDKKLLTALLGSSVLLVCGFLGSFSLKAAEIVFGIACAAVILRQPFWGIPVVFMLGMLGDSQHFAGGVSLVKGVMLLAAVGFLAQHPFQTIARRKTGAEIPLILFIVVYCLGNLLKPSETYDSSVILTWVGYPAAFLLVLYLVNTKARIEWALGFLLAGATLEGLSSAIEQFFGVNVLSSLRGVDEVVASNGPPDMQRINGLLQDPNAAAYMHIIAIPIIISLILLSKSWSHRFGLIGLSLVSLFSLLLSFSRSGYIAVLLGLLYLLSRLNLRKTIWILLSASLLVTIVFAFVPAATVVARFYDIQGEIGGESDRSLYYLTGAQLMLEHPLIPAGETMFMSAISQKTGIPQGPHSNTLSAGVNAGLIGLSAFLWLMYRYTRYVRRGIRNMRSKPLLYYSLGAFAGTIGFQVQGLFMTNFGWFLMWGVAAIPLCCILTDQAETPVCETLAPLS